MANITPVPDAYIPKHTLSAAEVKALFFDNDAGVRLLTYGARDPEGASPGHDHAEDGGVHLGYPLLDASLGPQGPEDGSGTTQAGIPLGRPASGSLATTPKLVASGPLFLPGGVENLTLYLLVSWDGTDAGATMTLGAVIGTLAMTNYDATNGPGVRKTGSVTTTGSAAFGVVVISFEDEELAQLGDPALDRELELRLFQEYDPASGKVHRLLGALAVKGDGDPVRSARRGDAPRAELVVADLLEGAGLLTPDLAATIKQGENQRAISVLGAAPGLLADGLRADRRRPWRQTVSAVHTHEGAFVPDGAGGFLGKGAILPRPLLARSFPRNLGDNSSYAVNVLPYQGILLHPNGGASLDGEWLELGSRIAVAAGQASIRVRAALQVASDDPSMAVHLEASLVPEAGGSSILTAMRTRRYSAHEDDAGVMEVEVGPEDNDAWRPGSPWGQSGILRQAEVPAGVETTNAVQISEPVELFLTHPAIRSTDSAHATGYYTLTLGFSAFSRDAGTFDADARLCWVQVLPGRG